MFELLFAAELTIAQVTSDYYCFANLGDGVIDLTDICPQPETLSVFEAGDTATTDTFESAFIPFAGQVCGDFATQGEAQYHYLRGTAPDSLDGDNDGIACEEMAGIPNRTSGQSSARYNSTKYSGVSITLMDVGRRNINGDFYLRINAPGFDTFTTQSFTNKADAISHMETYYGYTQGL